MPTYGGTATETGKIWILHLFMQIVCQQDETSYIFLQVDICYYQINLNIIAFRNQH